MTELERANRIIDLALDRAEDYFSKLEEKEIEITSLGAHHNAQIETLRGLIRMREETIKQQREKLGAVRYLVDNWRILADKPQSDSDTLRACAHELERELDHE